MNPRRVIAVVLEQRFSRLSDGSVWGLSGFSDTFWKRYLAIFDEVVVIARLLEARSIPRGYSRADAVGVTFHAVPHYIGPLGYLGKWRAVAAAVRAGLEGVDVVVLRTPSVLAVLARRHLDREGRTYAVEVVGDPREALGPGAVRHPLRPVARWWLSLEQSKICRRAVAGAYVTAHSLQTRYPLGPCAWGTHFSSVELQDDAFTDEARVLPDNDPATIVSVGSLDHYHKGADVLHTALRQCLQNGIDVRLVWVGSGRYLEVVRRRMLDDGLGHRVTFVGQVTPGAAVREILGSADLFVLASRTEGLPRALVEAMALGVPCVATRVGGIPELLRSDQMVPPGDPDALAAKIKEFLGDRELRKAVAEQGLKTARRYHRRYLEAKRTEFYTRLRSLSERSGVR